MKSRSFLFPCKNRTEECEAKLKLQGLHQHDDTCPCQNACVNVPQGNVKIGVVLGEDSAQKCGHTSNKYIPKIFLCQNIGCVIKGFDLIGSFWSVF
jgi:hypothetical protein